MINVGSDFSGVGAFNQALDRLNINYKTVFACDWDKFARKTYVLNYGNSDDIVIVNSKEHDFCCDEMIRFIEGKIILSKLAEERFFIRCEALARSFSFYYPLNVYNRLIPENPLDIYMTSPPCQAFSLAGKRKGEKDKRGVLFYNSHEFIVKNKPRYFIFENVKGLKSDDSGKTFNRWLDYLGGKSVNGNPVIFPLEDATPYHVYHKVLNAKNYGVPQNRDRVFIVGIRDDADNTFHWPKPFPLVKRLKDVLENDVDQKYYLSDKLIKGFISHKDRHEEKGTGFKWQPKNEDDIANALRANGALCPTDNSIKIGYINQDTQASKVFSEEGTSPTLSEGTHGYAQGYIKVKSATKKGFEIANEGDSINLSNLNSETRRGRVGKEVAQTLDTACNQSVMIAHVSRSEEGKRLRREAMANGKKDFTPFQAKQISFKESDVMNCVTTATTKDNLVKIGAIRGRGNENNQQLEINQNGTSNSLTTVQKDNVVIQINPSLESGGKQPYQGNRVYDDRALSPTLQSQNGGASKGSTIIYQSHNYKIRRLTPRECFRLMDFPDTFTWPVSNSQAYKQAGNSIVVAVLAGVISKLNL